MNRDSIIKFADGVFDSISQVNDDTYVAELGFGTGSTAGVYYLDFNSKIKDVDFKKYQRELLGKEYFRNRGSIQWNYYLLILQDNLDQKKKREIELDDQFARKYVFNENEFKDFFTIDKSEDGLEKNVTEEWKDQLDKVGLSEVYGKAAMSHVVERFANGNINEAEAPTFSEDGEVLEVKKIDKIELTDDYREYPKKHRSFNFGKANLVYGINGVGKTSLFEAIELILCGKTLSNPDDKEESGAIKMSVNGKEDKVEYIADNATLYKNRDLFWYSNPKGRSNNLPESFSRFNYFNSDAAYRFANNDDENTIKNALYNLVLGPEYNHLKERVEKIWTSLLRPEYNRLKKQFEQEEDELTKAKKELENVKISSNIEVIEKSIFTHIENLGLKVEISDLEKDYVNISLKLNELSATLSEILKIVESNSSRQSIDAKLKSLKEFESDLKYLREKLLNLQKEKELLNQRSEKTRIKSELLERASVFFETPNLFEVKGVRIEKIELERKVEKILKVKLKLSRVSLDQVRELSDNFEKSLEESLKLRASRKEDLDKVKRDIDGFVARLGELDSITSNIKKLGVQFIELIDKNSNPECPLCHSDFEYVELASRIERIDEDADEYEAKKLKDLNDKEKSISKIINVLNGKIETLYVLKECLSKLDTEEDEIENLSIKEGVDLLEQKIKDLEPTEKRIREINELQDFFDSHKVSEIEYNEIVADFSEHYQSFKFSKESSLEFEGLKLQLNKEREDLQKSLKEALDQESALRSEFVKKHQLEVENQFELSEISKEGELSRLSSVIDMLDSFSNELKVENNTLLNLVERDINALSKIVEQYKGEIKNRSQVDFWEKQIKKSKDFLDGNKEKLGRLSRGNSELERILNEMTSNTYLQEFFDGNIAEIYDIFKTIHVPKEFVEMSFSEGKLALLDVEGRKRKITEISTGQRSALALSIFLCLNRKLKNGPNILMFDDPVSFIDDFNALSFLDFLRYFVLKENKQLFFATANIKLANLFKKKFNFLDHDFQNWELTREEIIT